MASKKRNPVNSLLSSSTKITYKNDRIRVPSSVVPSTAVPSSVVPSPEITEIQENLKCAPKADGETQKTYSCYSDEALMKLRDLWNARHPQEDMRINATEPFQIWTALKKAFQYTCKRESCWLKQSFVKSGLDKRILNYTFSPDKPEEWNLGGNLDDGGSTADRSSDKKQKDEDIWLSSLDINKVMHQYEQAHKEFDFIGPSPIDFDTRLHDGECVWEELCKFDLSYYLDKGKFKIGIIFNLDTHEGGGTHWISMFIDVRKRFILLFDSNGVPVPKEVHRLVDRIQKDARELGFGFRILENRVKHQRTNTECGMYSLFAIIHLLNEEMTPDQLVGSRIPDKVVFEYRNKYFN